MLFIWLMNLEIWHKQVEANIQVERSGVMSKYNLDQSSGLLSLFSNKNIAKIVKLDSSVDIKHFKMFEFINASVLERTENSIKIEVKEHIQETLFFPEDHLVINYSDNKELYVMSGTVTDVFNLYPLVLKVVINNVEKLKDLRKHERYYVSLTSNIKVAGFITPVFAVVKNISSGGIKVNCKDQLTYEDVLEVEVVLDRTNKLVFSGVIVRKNKVKDYYEYGIEIRGISESNLKCLYHYLNWLNSEYR